ncbi:MAG: DNA mismatch repair protein MutS [Gemmatimonadaceae bacterium]|nr:DNA mismatch repair protein MutS [Gemmatimonadaceae bacterium]
MTFSDVADRYRARAAWHAQRAEESESRAERIGKARLLCFALILLAFARAASPTPTNARSIAAAAAIALVTIFVALIVAHRRERRALELHEAAQRYNELGAHRIARDWSALPVAREIDPPSNHPYAGDLDILGHASLFQLLDVVSATPGRRTLRSWLLTPPPSATEITERQAAARELRDRAELREQLEALAILTGNPRQATLDRFLDWCESPPRLTPRQGALWAARAITALTMVTLLLQAAGVISQPIWLASGAVGLLIARSVRAHLSEAIHEADQRRVVLRHNSAMFALVEEFDATSPRIKNIRARMAAGGRAAEQFRNLERILAWAEVRYSPMLHAVLQLFFMWDVHVVARLERWQATGGAHARDWMAALGELEVLAAFATLAHDHPDWTFPEILDCDPPTIDAWALGHPLLPPSSCVRNDVAVGPPGTFLLITGSNMSGKSTLLRAIGVNTVLAQAGAPVCAARLRLPLTDIYTSIRVQDSLEQGVSLFMAELRRLKAIVDAARDHAHEREHRRALLYLLDEILHGTNTAERQIAARLIIGHLVDAGAIGAVTTHDLSLAAGGPIAGSARPVHFTEHFDDSSGKPTMCFDYRLRPGLATSANALALVELMGLADPGTATR